MNNYAGQTVKFCFSSEDEETNLFWTNYDFNPIRSILTVPCKKDIIHIDTFFEKKKKKDKERFFYDFNTYRFQVKSREIEYDSNHVFIFTLEIVPKPKKKMKKENVTKKYSHKDDSAITVK